MPQLGYSRAMQPAGTPPPLPSPAVSRKPSSGKRVLTVLVLLVLAFAGGYIPERLRADRLEETLRTTTLDLELSKAHRSLGVAAVEAQRNNFASAATAAAVFFDSCARLATNPGLADEPRTREAISAYAASRDAITVQLATADPSVAQRLASLYFTMDGVIARRQ